MAQVPYNPVPEAQPSGAATPTLQLNKKAAFGENIAAGLDRAADGMARMAQGADALARGQQKLAEGMGEEAAGITNLGKAQGRVADSQAQFGKALDHAGTEIFGRAIALQNLVNDADAREATTGYMMRVADLHAEFNARQGKDAIDALPKFKEDLVTIRKEIREGLKNPMAQKLYDSESQGTMSRTMFSGAAHAATAAKSYSIQQLEAELTYKKNAPYADPNDPVEFATRRDEIVAATYRLGSLKAGISDPNDPMMKAGVLIATSEQRANQLIAVARKQPNVASGMLEEFKGELTIGDYQKVENIVRTQSRSVGSANIGRDVWMWGRGDPNTPPKPLEEMNEEARRRAKQLDPNDPLLEKHAVDAVWANYNQGRRGQIDAERTNRGIVAGAIGAGVKDERELRLDPKVAKAIDALPDAAKNAIPARINSFNKSRDLVTNQETDRKILGIMRTDKEKFLDLDIESIKDLSATDKRKYLDFQLKIKENPRDDPRVMRAASIIRASRGEELKALKVDRFTDQNSDQYYAYLGTLADAIDQWQEDHAGKKPTDKELAGEIATNVIKQRSEPWLFGLLSEPAPFFQQPASKDQKAFDNWVESKKEMAKARGGSDPSPQELKRAWTREMYKQTYGKTKKVE